MRTCRNCGYQMDTNAAVCDQCGAPMPAVRRTTKRKPKKNYRLLVLGGGAAAVLAVVILVIVLLSNPWKQGLNNYIDLVYKGKASAVVKAGPKEAWAFFDQTYGVSRDDAKAENKSYAADASEHNQDTYGDNVNYTYKVVKKKKYTAKMLRTVAEGLKNEYNIDKDSVKAAYRIKVEYDISGKEAFTWGEESLTIVKIDGSWYVIGDMTTQDGQPRCTLAGMEAIYRTATFSEEISK